MLGGSPTFHCMMWSLCLETSLQPEAGTLPRSEPSDKRSSSSKFQKIINHQWTIKATATIAGTIFGSFLTWFVPYIQDLIAQKTLHEIWDNVLRGQSTIPIVYGVNNVKGFILDSDLGKEKAVLLPKNVPMLGVPEAIGIAHVSRYLASAFGKNRLIFEESDQFNLGKTVSSFVSIGGASINKVTHDLLDERRLDSKFKMIYPDHYAIDEADGNQYKPEKKSDPNALDKKNDFIVTKDYGFIIAGPNPYNSQKIVVLAFGIWPQGTSAALETLINPDINGNLGKLFIEKIKLGKGLVAIVETDVAGLQRGRPKFVKVRDLMPK